MISRDFLTADLVPLRERNNSNNNNNNNNNDNDYFTEVSNLLAEHMTFYQLED